MAYACGRLFVPVVEPLRARVAPYGYEDLAKVDPSRGTGELVALDAGTGKQVWSRKLPRRTSVAPRSRNGVVFTSTFDGRVYALAAATGLTLWQARAPAGVNGCPAVDGDMLLVGAGSKYPGRPDTYELLAFRLASGR